MTRRVRQALLFAWVFSLTYNRQFFWFEPLVGSHGFQGPYWIVADLFLAGLLGSWALRKVLRLASPGPVGPPLLRCYLPFAAACLLSVAAASRPEWTLFEMIRVAKVALVLIYARQEIGRREWWVCVAALGSSLAAQGALGTLEVVARRSGVLWLVGLGEGSRTYEEQIRIFGWMRATATMNHPPVLASYHLLVLPLLLSLSLALPRGLPRSLCRASAGVGLAGLGATLSRWPWVLMALLLLAIPLLLARLELVPVRRALGVFASAGLALLAVAVLLGGLLSQRVFRDLEASVEQRVQGNRWALAMIRDHPLLGVGLNNARFHVLRHDPEQDWMLELEETGVRSNVRFLTAPGNGFLLPLMETGVLGFLTFLGYLLGVVRAGARAPARGDTRARAACLGLFLGILAVLAEQLVDCTYWVDPILYAFTLVAALLGNSAVLSGPGPPPAGAGEAVPGGGRPFQVPLMPGG